MCVHVCLQEGDAWWFSVGTKSPVGVDNPKARPLTGAEDETGRPPGGSALCLISVSHTLYFLIFRLQPQFFAFTMVSSLLCLITIFSLY